MQNNAHHNCFRFVYTFFWDNWSSKMVGRGGLSYNNTIAANLKPNDQMINQLSYRLLVVCGWWSCYQFCIMQYIVSVRYVFVFVLYKVMCVYWDVLFDTVNLAPRTQCAQLHSSLWHAGSVALYIYYILRAFLARFAALCST